MKSIAVASLLVAVVAAADSVVPSGISSACAANLNSLDTNAQLQSCLSSVLSATSSLTATSSSSAINTALTSLCSTSTATACPDSLFRSLLTQLYSDCKGDFGESTGTVAAIYDALYNEPTFRKSVCTTDPSTSKFCVETLAATAGAASSLVAEAQTFLSEASGDDSAVKFPNGTTWGSANLVFQFLNPQSPNAVLCSPCASAIVQAHITDETAFPFAPGISSSDILSGQNALWKAMQSNCAGANSIVANAGAAPSAAAPIAAAGALNGASNTKVSAGVLGALAAVSVVLTSL